ncbi:unnamed protein product [Paramecium sonneborni]|uniref:Arrestin-like N-terminal domain-containing protein n=1 Tax=Paramecium sonneborni TaxID=65129 RepID=A0A8S1NBZ7_9CILI|nr:unnamed protein product [Paramecium sonneborni]
MLIIMINKKNLQYFYQINVNLFIIIRGPNQNISQNFRQYLNLKLLFDILYLVKINTYFFMQLNYSKNFKFHNYLLQNFSQNQQKKMRTNINIGQKRDRSNIQPNNFGNILITTDKSFYFAGEIISGNIYFKVTQDGLPGCILYLGVIGKEKNEWSETTYHTERETKTDQNGNQLITETNTNKTENYKGKTCIYQHKVELHNFESDIQPLGDFVFPFQFQLSSSLPSSYYEEDRAQISYKVKALVQYKKSQILFIKHSQKLIIQETLRNYQKSLTQELQVTSLNFCFIKNGPCYVKCSINKFHFMPGEKVYLSLDIDNSRFDKPINKLAIKLYHKLELCDNKGNQTSYTSLEGNYQNKGVEARGKYSNNCWIVLSKDLLPTAIADDCCSCCCNFCQNCGQDCRSDCPCCCCPSNPKQSNLIAFPIQIIRPAFEGNGQFLQEPSDQKPQVFQTQKVYLTNLNKQEQNQNVVKYKIKQILSNTGLQIQQMQDSVMSE